MVAGPCWFQRFFFRGTWRRPLAKMLCIGFCAVIHLWNQRGPATIKQRQTDKQRDRQLLKLCIHPSINIPPQQKKHYCIPKGKLHNVHTLWVVCFMWYIIFTVCRTSSILSSVDVTCNLEGKGKRERHAKWGGRGVNGGGGRRSIALQAFRVCIIFV